MAAGPLFALQTTRICTLLGSMCRLAFAPLPSLSHSFAFSVSVFHVEKSNYLAAV